MARQRHAVLCLMVALIAARAATATRQHNAGPIRRLLRLLGGGATTTIPDAIVPEPAASQLLPPLWASTDADPAASTTSGGLSRTLKNYFGDEIAAPGGATDPDPDPQPNPARRALRNEDFVYVAPCTPQRLPLAQASRYWRKGMRAVFVMDQSADQLPAAMVANAARYRESFAWFPNFRRMANDKRDHYLEGDRRAAMTPLLAYATLADPGAMMPWTQQPPSPPQPQLNQPSPAAGAGPEGADPFQWILAGDDDTIFFMRGVKALLRDYDPQLPYFLSDSMYVGSKSPQPGVWEMRCYPCHMQWGRWRRAAARRLMATGGGAAHIEQPQPGPQGCGCSTEELCKRRFPGNETRCRDEWEGPVPFGGVGFIFSIGFFKHLAAARNGTGLRAYEACIGDPNTSVMSFPEGGDAFMSRCLWRLGFPITDPGYTPLGRYLGEVLQLKHLYEAPANLTTGRLPDDALTRWSTAVSMHLGARQHKSFKAAAMTIKYISGVYDLVAELLWPTGRKAEL